MIEISSKFSVRAESVSHIKIVECSNSNSVYNNGKPQTATKHWREVRLYILGKLEKTWTFNGSRKSNYNGNPVNEKEETEAEMNSFLQYKKLLNLLERKDDG